MTDQRKSENRFDGVWHQWISLIWPRKWLVAKSCRFIGCIAFFFITCQFIGCKELLFMTSQFIGCTVSLFITYHSLVALFDLILYVPSIIFQLNRDGPFWVELVLSKDKCVLLKDHNAVTPVMLEPVALRSQVKHSTTEPLRSLHSLVAYNYYSSHTNSLLQSIIMNLLPILKLVAEYHC